MHALPARAGGARGHGARGAHRRGGALPAHHATSSCRVDAGPEHLEVLRELGMASAMVVPMTARRPHARRADARLCPTPTGSTTTTARASRSTSAAAPRSPSTTRVSTATRTARAGPRWRRARRRRRLPRRPRGHRSASGTRRPRRSPACPRAEVFGTSARPTPSPAGRRSRCTSRRGRPGHAASPGAVERRSTRGALALDLRRRASAAARSTRSAT